MSNIYQAKGSTLVEQYEDVGKLFAMQLRKRIRQSKVKKEIAEKVLARIYTISGLETFKECFEAWARGGGISKVKAMYLLVDNLVGCQTMMVRYRSGVGMVHTEEDFDDPIARMEGAHTIEFNSNGRKLFTLTYNNLMPGTALYGWQSDVLIAVDALFLKEDDVLDIEKPMLANILGWCVWYKQSSELEPGKIITELSQYGSVVDGYAINVVHKNKTRIDGYKLLFTREHWEVEKLGNKVGNFLCQVNIFEQRWTVDEHPIIKWQVTADELDDYKAFIERQIFLSKLASNNIFWLKHKLTRELIPEVHKQILRRMFVDYRTEFVNEWMGAGMIGILDINLGVSVSCKLNDDNPLEEMEYISLL